MWSSPTIQDKLPPRRSHLTFSRSFMCKLRVMVTEQIVQLNVAAVPAQESRSQLWSGRRTMGSGTAVSQAQQRAGELGHLRLDQLQWLSSAGRQWVGTDGSEMVGTPTGGGQSFRPLRSDGKAIVPRAAPLPGHVTADPQTWEADGAERPHYIL